jgi:hypothetical protein
LSYPKSLKPGTEIVVSIRGGTRERRYLLAASDDRLTLLRHTLPATAGWALQLVAADHPEFLIDEGPARHVYTHDHARFRVESGEIFANDRSLGNVKDFIDVPRGDVSISGIPHYGRWVALAAVGVAFLVLKSACAADYSSGKRGCFGG